MNKLVIITLLVLMSFISFSSDHIDGPVTRSHRVADISDFYAFPTKNNKKLVLILNVYPFVLPNGHFSEKVSYDFILQKLKPINQRSSNSFEYIEKAKISCSFKTPEDHSKHSMNCITSKGKKSYSIFNKNNPSGSFKSFHGFTADPFFMDTNWAKKLSVSGNIQSPTGKNTIKSLNTLTVTLEIDLEDIFRSSKKSLIAIAAKSYRSKDKSLIDRVGRPEITNVSLIEKGKSDIRDQYNQEETFSLSANGYYTYQSRLLDRIEYFDKLDSKRDWKVVKRYQLADLLLKDFLLLDLDKECKKNSFFSIEKALLESEINKSCGGRFIEDDIVDTIFSLYINRLNGPVIADGVNKPARKNKSTFPYNSTPFTGLWARTKAKLAIKAGF